MTAIRRSLGSNTQSTQSLLQHLYFIAAVAIVLALIIIRIAVLRWRNRPISQFFWFGGGFRYASRPPNDPNHSLSYPEVQLTPLPAAYHPDRRIRAADTDAQGRRLGLVGEEWGGKDALPAYDSFDRPPKYIEAGWSQGYHVGQSPSPEGEQSGMAHPDGDDTCIMTGTTHHDS